MKSQCKTVALSAIFSVIGLCFTLSTASAESSNIKVNQQFTTATNMSSFPRLTNEGDVKNKPLLKPGNKPKEFSACESTTKNEYFELAIIFNDKLQEFISVLFVDDINSGNNPPLNQMTKLD
jgi:hypothetical protein